jgi:uncharacterized membrane protein YdjX (TVP38/TMEM64 family)
MRDLLIVAGVLAAVFASTFLVFERTGLTSEEAVRGALDWLAGVHWAWVAGAVVALLLLDLFVAVPTMTTILLAGHLLGPVAGGAVSALGLMILGTTGYGIGRRYGRAGLVRLYGGGERLAGIEAAFARNDLLTLVVCQALPILPELSCCLAGIARMRFARFLLGYAAGVVPFAFVVAWAGAESTLADPWPAIYTAIGVTAVLLLAWGALRRRAA